MRKGDVATEGLRDEVTNGLHKELAIFRQPQTSIALVLRRDQTPNVVVSRRDQTPNGHHQSFVTRVSSNVWISLWVGKRLAIIKQFILDGSITIITTEQLLEEIIMVTHREKLKK